MKSLVLFNNKGGVGKTTVTFHLAHMLARLGVRTVALDYDPQCNLTAAMIDEDELTELWTRPEEEGGTVAACLDLVRRGRGDLREPKLHEVADELWLLPGHLKLSQFEQVLAEHWAKTMATDNERALDVVLAMSALAHAAANSVRASVVLCDIGPSLGALNRAAVLACNAVAVPLAPDLFSLQGLSNVGPSLVSWRSDWTTVCERHLRNHRYSAYAENRFQPIGYILQQQLVRADRPLRAYLRWANEAPYRFREQILGETPPESGLTFENDPNCIAQIRHFASLVPLAQEARKPMFDLRKADGVSGGGLPLVQECKQMFERLAREICHRLEVLVS